MSQQRAFTLIEVVVAMVIASMLGIILFQVLNQVSGSVRTVEGMTSSVFNVVGFYDRFERDVCCAFIPEMGDPERVMQAIQKQVKKLDALAQQKGGGQKLPDPAGKPPPPVTLKNVQVKKVFICENKGDNMALFSFITCNPLQVYGQSKPRIARIIYTLVDDPRTPGTKKLLRQESPQLGFDGAQQARTYVLLRNIKSLRLEFLAPAPQVIEEESAEKKTKPAQTKIDKKQKKDQKMQAYASWPLARDKGKDGQRTEKIRNLPHAVKVYLQYRDPFGGVIKPYEFLFTVYNYQAPTELMSVQIVQDILEHTQDADGE